MPQRRSPQGRGMAALPGKSGTFRAASRSWREPCRSGRLCSLTRLGLLHPPGPQLREGVPPPATNAGRWAISGGTALVTQGPRRQGTWGETGAALSGVGGPPLRRRVQMDSDQEPGTERPGDPGRYGCSPQSAMGLMPPPRILGFQPPSVRIASLTHRTRTPRAPRLLVPLPHASGGGGSAVD